MDFIETDSPAAAAGIQRGDVIVRIGNDLILDGEHFVRAVGTAAVGTQVPVRLHRKKQVMTIQSTLKRRELPAVAVTRESRRFRWRGMLLGPIPSNWPQRGQAQQASSTADAKSDVAGLLVIGVEPNSPMVKSGIKAGSVIRSVAGQAVRDVTDLQRVINDTPADQCCGVQLADQGAVVVSIGQ